MILQELQELLSRNDALEQDIPAKELHCYSLPFGMLGFVSHVLTYYTIACLWFGRKPLWPFKRISNSKFDLVLGFIGVSLCIIMSIVTMIKCKNTWQLLVIAVWKLSMSLLNGLTALHVAILYLNQPRADLESESGEQSEVPIKSKQTAWWIVLYIPGMGAGMVGLMSLVTKVADRVPELLALTLAFYASIGASVIIGVLSMLIICFMPSSNTNSQTGSSSWSPAKVALTGFIVTVILFIVLSAFYCDWCLGIMLDNLLGVPTSDSSGLYWTYFIAKRLTMFSL